MVAEATVSKETRRMKELNKIDGLIGATNVGAIVDLYNQNLDAKRDREFKGDLNDRNKYFAPLWQRAIEDIRLGMKPKKKEKYITSINKKIYFSKNKKIIVK